MKILVCGPECSGKTTLSQYLSECLDIACIPEYAVSYLDAIGPRSYREEDLLQIAQGHFRLFEAMNGGRSFVMDTFLLNLKIWSLYRFNRVDPWIDTMLNELRFDLVFLLMPDIDWEDANYRENPGDRDVLFNMYKRELECLCWEYTIIEGKFDERKERALLVAKDLEESMNK